MGRNDLPPTDGPDPSLLEDQIAYYEARAPEYDRMLERSGSYLGGRRTGGDAPDDDLGWARLGEILAEFHPSGHVLEIAAGTGVWTEHLRRTAARVTAIDASPAMVALSRRRLGSERVDHVVADVFAWTPPARYDVVFFGFWLSHVPPARFEPFFELVRRCLTPDGRLLFFDETFLEGSAKWEERLDEATGATRRRLDDGRSFRMVKVYHEPATLQTRLRSLGWDVEVGKASTRFLYGRGCLAPAAGVS